MALARLPTAEMSLDEVAEALGLTRGKVYDRLRAGLIPHARVGKRYVIWRKDFLAWLDQGKAPAHTAAPDLGAVLRLLAGQPMTFEVTIRLKDGTR